MELGEDLIMDGFFLEQDIIILMIAQNNNNEVPLYTLCLCCTLSSLCEFHRSLSSLKTSKHHLSSLYSG